MNRQERAKKGSEQSRNVHSHLLHNTDRHTYMRSFLSAVVWEAGWLGLGVVAWHGFRERAPDSLPSKAVVREDVLACAIVFCVSR